jgi:hypothetical protein
LLVEFGAETKEESDAQARRLTDRLQKKGNAPSMKLYDNPADEKKTWTVRRSGLGATAHVPEKKSVTSWSTSAPDGVARRCRSG